MGRTLALLVIFALLVGVVLSVVQTNNNRHRSRSCSIEYGQKTKNNSGAPVLKALVLGMGATIGALGTMAALAIALFVLVPVVLRFALVVVPILLLGFLSYFIYRLLNSNLRRS